MLLAKGGYPLVESLFIVSVIAGKVTLSINDGEIHCRTSTLLLVNAGPITTELSPKNIHIVYLQPKNNIVDNLLSFYEAGVRGYNNCFENF